MSDDQSEKFMQKYDVFHQTLNTVPKIGHWTPYSVTSLMETSYTYGNSTPGIDRARRALEEHARKFEEVAWEELKALKSTEFTSRQIVTRIRKQTKGREQYKLLLDQLKELGYIAQDMQRPFEDLCMEADAFGY